MTSVSTSAAKPLILIVDDSPDNLRVLSTTLNQHGYAVRCVKTGPLALLNAQTDPPELILLDIRMPHMDGYEICRRFKQDSRTRAIPVIFLSALDEALDKVQAFEAGAADYITKPFQIEEVLARVEHQLTIQQLQKQLIAQNKLLQAAKDSAESASAAKSEFLSRMSHELRTPLNVILGYSQLLMQDAVFTPEQQEELGIIYQSGEHLLALINDVLEMSKIEAGQISIHQSHFDLLELLSNLEEMFRLKATSKNLQLILDPDPTVPRFIYTDKSKLRQILINLLNNAIKFTYSGGIAVRVRTTTSPVASIPETPVQLPALDTEPSWLQFEIEDTGLGIAPTELSQLFQPYMQTETGQRSHQGTGLGLTICQKFVNLLGGEIHLTSTVNQGTTVRFQIQLHHPQTAAVLEPVRSRRASHLAADQPCYRVLVAEDQPASRALLVRLLEPLGFEVREAATGQAAVEIWQDWKPHLIWMDMRMPVLDGYAATQQIKAHPQGTETIIIALTASAFEEERSVILDAGCDDFVRKPYRDEVIFEKMATHLSVQFIYETV